MKFTKHDIEQIIRSLPGSDLIQGQLTITPLFSGTNFVYIVEAPGTSNLVFREFGDSALIDRQQEQAVFKLASDQAIGPKIIKSHADYRVEEYLDGKTLERLDCASHLPSISRALAQFHKLSEPAADNSIVLYIQSWKAKLLHNLTSSSHHSEKKLELIKLIEENYEEALKLVVNDSEEFVLSHNDFSYGNLIVQEQEIRIIDYEYAGPGHPSIDLASLIIETMFDFSQPEYQYLPQDELTLAQQTLLVNSYSQIQKLDPADLWGKVKRSKAVVCYLGALWAGCNYSEAKASMLDYALTRIQLFFRYKSELS